MAEDGEIDIEGDFEFKLDVDTDIYDELPSKSANLLPEYTNPAWMLEQGWTMDTFDEKSKATIEKMLQEEHYYTNGKGSPRRGKTPRLLSRKPPIQKQPWTEEEKVMFEKYLEVFGRSWSKIAELMPNRTSLQVKNYGQQYFNRKAKEDAKSVDSDLSSPPASSTSGSKDSPVGDVLSLVTTAQTTVTTVTKPRNSSPRKKSMLEKMLINNGTKYKEKNKLLVGPQLFQKMQKTKSDPSGKKREAEWKEDVGASSSRPVVGKQRKTENPEEAQGQVLVVINSAPPKLVSKTESLIPPPTGSLLVTAPSSVGIGQLSPSLESRLQQSTGVIENLDRFCAVADIVTEDEDEDGEIDIENEDEENPILKSRSASPNSVYEQLIRAANLSKPAERARSKEIDVREKSPEVEQIQVKAVSDHSVEKEIEVIQKMENEIWKFNRPKSINSLVLWSGEIMDFPVPTQEANVDQGIITEEERRIHADFFDGRPSKTPERYSRIRNYILEAWKKWKPGYLNKTCVRPGLKNCGDVNCIGRIHSYLECIGAINFSCEQASYNQTSKPGLLLSKERATREAIVKLSFSKSESMRPRKRRIRNEYGQWVDEKELQGKTIQHQDKILTKESSGRVAKTPKVPSLDPFKLIPCQNFSQERPAPFYVEIHNTALVIMDIHSHVSKTEVIGMLGGCYHGEDQHLEITMAIPCNSVSTGLQCEMDPVSQTFACEEINNNRMNVVGWYHSHPTFNPNPSIRDIETQLKFQDYFAQDGFSFIGVIVSPYNRTSQSLCSEFQCLTISSELSLVDQCNVPFSFNYGMIMQSLQSELVIRSIKTLAEKYSLDRNRVELLQPYLSITSCLNKMLESLKDSLEPNSDESTQFLEIVREIFTALFSNERNVPSQVAELQEMIANTQS
ncbi:deubiquitinase MYSM1-like [Ostrea edulis]|uniref:deubiquitinase MYSM1-like n=1 Tax=Ostrea edulis TaxID=37623 RepID=UPI0024AECBA3|nr:deubiquitinase MYSM1-like [Ostrea edulis]